MIATLTSKGQITLPKAVRDRLQLDVGDTLDFQILPDNTLAVRAVKPDARRVRGLLKSPLQRAPTVRQMDAAVEAELRAKHPPSTLRKRQGPV